MLCCRGLPAQQKREQVAQADDIERVSTNTIHKKDAHRLERTEGRNYSHKEPKVVHGVKLSKKEWRKRAKEQRFESKPVKKQPKGSSKTKKAAKAKSSK